MRQPKELSDSELAQIAFKVRTRLETRWGQQKVSKLFQGPIGGDLLKETYVAVREQLEKEQLQ